MASKAKLALLIGVLVLSMLFSSIAFAKLICDVKNPLQPCNGVVVFRMSAQANAHAELPSQANYEYSVCCSHQTFALGNDCNGLNAISLLNLSADTNAHVEKWNYGLFKKGVCLSSPDFEPYCVVTEQDCQEPDFETCLATLSGDTNAHVADCLPENAYSKKVCCKSDCIPSPEDCTNNHKDDDCDTLSDCDDPDCDGAVIGAVKDKEKITPLENADIKAYKDLILFKSTKTIADGTYSLGIKCGAYSLAASLTGYISQAKNINVPPKQTITVDFDLLSGTLCQPDCTLDIDDVVHGECEGRRGCFFCDERVRQICDLAQYGWRRDYNETHYVICEEGDKGCPREKQELKADVKCKKDTIVKTTRIITYNGKPAKLIVAVCG